MLTLMANWDIDSRQQHIHNDGGGVLSLPAGTLRGNFNLRASNIIYRGEGINTTYLETNEGYGGHLIQSSLSYSNLRSIVFEDMTLIGSVVLYGAHVHDVVFRHVHFPVPTNKTAVTLSGCPNVTFDHCQFNSPGDAGGTGVIIANGSCHVKFKDCVFDYLKSGIVIDSGHDPYTEIVSDIVIDNCRFIFDHWTLKSISDGAALYTENSLIDSSATFSFPALTHRNVRIMPVRATGTMGWSPGLWLIDDTAQFIAASILPGDIVRTDVAFAIVLNVETDTRLRLDVWRSLEDYRPLPSPLEDEPYTVYGVLIGAITSYTETQINVDCWRNLCGQISIPANGTHYEVIGNHTSHPVHAEWLAQRIVVRDCYVRGSWGDQLSLYGPESTIIGNGVFFGQDMGLTVHGDRSIIQSNRVEYSGASNILVTGKDTIINTNHLLNARCYNTVNIVNLADIHIRGDRTRVLANTCTNTGVGMYGLVISEAENIVLRDNVIRGHTEASLKLIDGAQAEYADNYFDNDVIVI